MAIDRAFRSCKYKDINSKIRTKKHRRSDEYMKTHIEERGEKMYPHMYGKKMKNLRKKNTMTESNHARYPTEAVNYY